MKQTFHWLIIALLALSACKNNETGNKAEHWIALRSDTLNIVRLSDTMVIYESVCRACAYEESTHFDVVDSSGLVRLESIVTNDDNPSHADGGSISKNLLLLATRTGNTAIKMYRFNIEQPTAEDSAKFTVYNIQIIPD